MYVLPSDRVEVIPDPENLWGVIGYALNLGGTKLIFRKNDVIHWRSMNLSFDAISRTHLRGLPPLKPGESILQQNKDATRASVRHYQNDGAKGFIFEKSKAVMTPVQQAQIKGVIDAKINNNEMAGSIAALQGDWGAHIFGASSQAMQLLEGKKATIRELCFLFEVPPEMFDTETTYDNKKQAQKNWVSNSIIPASKELDDELNRILLKAFLLEGKALIACDYMELPEMQADMKELSEWMNSSDEITPNERREAKGYEKRPEAEFDEPWIGGKPLSAILKENEPDDFDNLMAEVGITGDYKKPVIQNGQSNGKKN